MKGNNQFIILRLEMKVEVAIGVMLLLLAGGAGAFNYEKFRDQLIESHINMNCGASIAFFGTHFYSLYLDGLLGSVVPQAQEWALDFLLNSISSYWMGIYDDLQDYPPLYNALYMQLQVYGPWGTVSYLMQYVAQQSVYTVHNLVDLMEQQWANSYPGEFGYYKALFKSSCSFTYLFARIKYF